MNTISKVQKIGKNLLVAIAYGDSAGLAVETKTAQEIKKQYGSVDHLLDIDNPYFDKSKAGTWSDDTQLSLAIANSLILSGEFNIDSIANEHVKALESTPLITHNNEVIPRGWGKSTWQSVNRLKTKSHSPYNSGDKSRAGNGVLMKLAPLAFWQFLTFSSNDRNTIEILTRMTHDSDLAVVTSLVHRDVLVALIEDRIKSGEVIDFASSKAKYYEKQYPEAKNITSQSLASLSKYKNINQTVINKLAPKGGFFAPETLVLAYGVFNNNDKFSENIFEAVNFGGDTDSVASIVGGMSVMLHGDIDMPSDIDLLEDLDLLIQTGQKLVDRALTR